MNITDYLMPDELELMLSGFTEMTAISFSIRTAGDNPETIGQELPENTDDIPNTPIEGNGDIAATLYAIPAADASSEKVEKALSMLKELIENRLQKEAEIESLSMEVANNYEELNVIFQNNNIYADILEVDTASDITLERALTVSGGTMASIMFFDKDKETLKLYKRTGGREGALDNAEIPAKGSMWERVIYDLQPLLIEDVSRPEEVDPEAFAKADIFSFATRTFLSVPLKVKEEAIGVLNVGDKAEGVFTAVNMKFLGALAQLAASTIEKARLYKNIEKEAKLRANFQRYLSPTIVDDIINNNREMTLGGEVIECSVLFSDICGFTSLSEKEKPETIVHLLNEYFSIMTEIIFRNNGTLDKFIGDAIMAVFGAPIFSPKAHRNAIAAGIEMHQALGRLRVKWQKEGLPVFKQRIGVNTGIVVAGNIGSPDRMDYTVIGDVVNLASRMETAATPMTVRISENTYEKIKDSVTALELDPIMVKGKAKPIRSYEIHALHPEKTDMDSVRRFDRLDVAISFTIREEGVEKNYEGTILNLSMGGALIALNNEIALKKKVAMTFALGSQNTAVTIAGKTVYLKKLKDAIGTDYWHVGIEFDDSVKEYEQKLKAYISRG